MPDVCSYRQEGNPKFATSGFCIIGVGINVTKPLFIFEPVLLHSIAPQLDRGLIKFFQRVLPFRVRYQICKCENHVIQFTQLFSCLVVQPTGYNLICLPLYR